MQTAQSVVVNILINANNQAAQSQWNATMQYVSDRARQSAQSSALSFQSLFGADFFAGLATDAVKSFASVFTDGIANVTLYAARTEELGVALQGLARVNNLNTDSIRAQEKALKDANIATQTAREALTKFIAAGLPLQSVSPLAAVAKDLAVIAGVSSSEELDRLINGITTLQVRVLRTAGVYVSLNEAEKKWAAENGKTLQTMTTQEKQQVALNEVLQFGTRAQGLYEDAMNTTSKQLRSLTRIQNDFSDAIGTNFIPALGALVFIYGGLLKMFTASPAAFFAVVGAITALTVATIASATGLAAMTAAEIATGAAGSALFTILETVAGAMIVVATGAEYTAGTLIIATAGFAAIGIAIAAVILALNAYADKQANAAVVTDELIAKNSKSLALYQDLKLQTDQLTQATNTTSLAQVRSGDAHDRLNDILGLLDPTTRTYISTLTGEQNQIKTLNDEIDRGIKLRHDIADAQARAISIAAGQNADTIKTNTNTSVSLGDELNTPTLTDRALFTLRQGFGENKDFEELRREQNKAVSDQINQLTADNVELTKSFDLQVAKLIPLQKTLGLTNDEFNQYLLNATGSKEQTDVLTNSLDRLRSGVGTTTDALKDANKQLEDLFTNLFQANNASERTKGLRELGEHLAEQFKDQPGKIPGLIKTLRETSPTFKQQIDDQKGYNEAFKNFTDAVDTAAPKIHKTKTETESLGASVKKLNAEIASFYNAGTRAFDLRFQKEDLERTKRDLESILNLRHQLNLPLASPLPKGDEATRAELANLERIKGLRDALQKTADVQLDAEIKLAKARFESTMAVVDAQTIADTAYFEGIRHRNEAEQQLTADIVGEIRKRETMATDSARNIATAQAEAYKEFLGEQNNADNERLKTLSKAQAYLGQSFANNPLVQLAQSIAAAPKGETQSPVLSRMDQTNDLLAKIYASISNRTVGGGDGAYAAAYTGGGAVDFASAPSKRAKQVLQSVIAPSKYDPQIGQAAQIVARETGVSADVVGTLIKATLFRESSGIGGQTSDQNAQGFFQQQPGTQRALGVRDPNNFLQSAIGAGRYLVRGISPNDRTGGLLGGGVAEAFATYFAGEGGGNRGTKTARYVRDQSYVFKQVMQWLASTATGAIGSTGAHGAAHAQPNVGGDTDFDFSKSLDNLQKLTPITEKYFGMKADDKRLTLESATALANYAKAQHDFYVQGSEGLKANAVGQARLSQDTDYLTTSVGKLAVSEANLDDVRQRRARAVLPILREIATAYNTEDAAAEKAIITSERFLQQLDRKDPRLNEHLDSLFNAGIATQTQSAATDDQNNQRFLKNFASGDPRLNRLLSEQFNAGQSGNLRQLTTDVDTQRRLAATGNRNPAAESLQLEKDRLTVINSVGAAEAKNAEQRALYADQEATQARRTASVIDERTTLETKLAQIEDQRATGPVNQALRERVAVEQELLNIQTADLDAQTKIATLQVDIADKFVLHEKQATAAVLEHLNQVKSMTDIYAGAKITIIDGVFGGIDKLVTKISGNIPILSDLVKDLLGGFLKLTATPFLAKILGIPLGGGSGGGTGGGTSSGGVFDPVSIFTGLLNGGGAGNTPSGGTPPFVGNFASGTNGFALQNAFGSDNTTQRAGLSFLQNLFTGSGASGGGGSTSSTGGTLLDQLVAQTAGAHSPAHGGAGSAAGGAAQSVLGNLNLANLIKGIGFGQKAGSGGALAGALPLLGASLGAQLGGGGFGSILSGAGGALLGIGLTAAPTALAGTFLAPLFSNPFTAVAGAALLIGSIILSKNNQRRKEETQRTAILLDSKGQLNSILANMRSGQLDTATALSQADSVRANYLTQVGQLTDSKTRGIAQQVVRELDSIIAQIKSEGSLLDKKHNYADAFDNAIVPTFDSGGAASYVSTLGNMGVFTGSGGQSYGDIFNARLKRNEVVLTPQTIANLGGLDVMRRAGVLGIDQYNRSYLPPRPSTSAGSGGSSAPPIYNFIVADEESADKLFKNVPAGSVANKTSFAVFNGEGGTLVKNITKSQKGK